MENKQEIYVVSGDNLQEGTYYAIERGRLLKLLPILCFTTVLGLLGVAGIEATLLLNGGAETGTNTNLRQDVQPGVVVTRTIENCEAECDDLLDSIAKCRAILDSVSE